MQMIKKKCSNCKKIKLSTEFYKESRNRSGLSSSCKECRSKKDKKRYESQLGKFIYLIVVDEEVWWVGSTTNIVHRIENHRNKKSNGHFLYMCEQRNLNLENKRIEIWVCDTEKLGYNLTKEDLKYYEHKLIRYLISKGEPLLNTKINSKYIDRERYIDEIVFDDLTSNFEKNIFFCISNYKII